MQEIDPSELMENYLTLTSISEIYSTITNLLLFGSKLFKPKPCDLNYEDFAKDLIENNLKWARKEQVIPLTNIEMWESCCELYFNNLNENWLQKLYK